MRRGKNGLPENVTEYRDRHGKWRLRFRKKGLPTHHFKAKFGTPEFRAELEAARCAQPQTPRDKIRERMQSGSMSALIATYYGDPAYTGLAPSSQRTYRNILERFRADYGDLRVRTLSRAAIKQIIGDMADRPSAANNLLDRLRVLMTLAMDLGWRDDDPTYKVKGFTESKEGFHTWTEEEIEQYKARWAPGTRQRRAMMLMLYISNRRGDLVGLGRQHVSNGRLLYRQQKTGVELSVPIHSDLAEELRLAPATDLCFLTTEFGKPFTAAGFGNWFREQCNAAGLPHCSAHGLRKACARRLAEAGCSHADIKAITGHLTDKEVTRYIRAAEQKRLADRAIGALPSTNSEQPLANLRKSVGEPTPKN